MIQWLAPTKISTKHSLQNYPIFWLEKWGNRRGPRTQFEIDFKIFFLASSVLYFSFWHMYFQYRDANKSIQIIKGRLATDPNFSERLKDFLYYKIVGPRIWIPEVCILIQIHLCRKKFWHSWFFQTGFWIDTQLPFYNQKII